MKLKNNMKIYNELTIAHQNYAKDLKLHAFLKVNNRETGEDLVQQTFMKTCTYVLNGGEIEKMRSFLYHVLNNLIIDEYRKKTTTSLNALMEKGFDPYEANKSDPADDYDGKRAILLIDKLPVMYRRVMYLKYVEDLSLEEISNILQLPKNTIAVQIHRGIKKIRILYMH